MLVFRPITLEDLPQLGELAAAAGIGLTTLPKDPQLLENRITESRRSFERLAVSSKAAEKAGAGAGGAGLAYNVWGMWLSRQFPLGVWRRWGGGGGGGGVGLRRRPRDRRFWENGIPGWGGGLGGGGFGGRGGERGGGGGGGGEGRGG